MLKIGVFSRLSRISIRMLRHYDEVGLLKPAQIDPWTGYRYYEERQLETANQITSLRDMGFGIAAIGSLLSSSPAQWEQALLLQRAALSQQQQELKQQINRLESALSRLRKESIMSYEVICKTLPERYVASVRDILPSYHYEGRLWHILMQETKSLHMQIAHPDYSIGVYHDTDHREQDVDVEIQIAVQGQYPDTEHVHFYTVPPIRIASATYTGSYEQVPEVNTAVAAWMNAHGYELDGPMFSIYHVSPEQTRNPDELVTEACYPIRAKEASPAVPAKETNA